MTDRPDGACVTHREPRDGRAWTRADPGFKTCARCHERLHGWLSPLTTDDTGRPDSIPGLYVMLNPVPGVDGSGGRRAPGFASRSPANDYIVAMRDRRSIKRDPGDPHSVPGLLAAWSAFLVDDRGLIPPRHTVPDMAKFLDRNLDYISRQEWVEDLAEELRELHSQLRAIGQQRRRIGICPNTIDAGDTTRQCGAGLYAPLYGDQITCGVCGRQWARDEWLRLGRLLETG